MKLLDFLLIFAHESERISSIRNPIWLIMLTILPCGYLWIFTRKGTNNQRISQFLCTNIT